MFDKEEYNFSSKNLVFFILKKKKQFLVVSFFSIFLSFTISFTIEPLYKSSVILFPAHTGSISKSLLSNKVITKKSSSFGEDEELDQFLQILHSNEIKNKIIKKYDLMQHYKIDSDYPITDLNDEFEDKISFSRTSFHSLKITVYDNIPEIASNIANDISSFLDTIINNMQEVRYKASLEIVKKEYFDLKTQINLLEDSIKKIRKKGINDYESQAEVFNKEYANALAKGDKKAIKNLEEKLEILSNYGGEYIHLRDLLLFEIERMSILKGKYIEAKVDAEKKLPNKYIVNKAVKAEKKSYPIRWLIVLISYISTFIFTLFILILFEKKNKNF
ncbi:MAG: hypothetical protein B6I24_03210 [Bacteroidetes bacterium 4572_128]|nr:MAG: hypothetical protein B6I24_03210 [Bacteroidetes bacterium 4572_128]